MMEFDEPGQPIRTLYVGNLDPSVTEELLLMLFSPFGTCTDIKIIREVTHDPYAFVKYSHHNETQAALMAMNKRNVLGKELKVNWASTPGGTIKQDTSNHFHIYVGDLSPDIDSFQIKNAFSPFGEISDCKVIRDANTQMSKGYAFVCFVRKEDAENAIATMNGQWLGGRTIRTNWASGKGGIAIPQKMAGRPLLNYNEVYHQASSHNRSVYCVGVQSGLTEELLRDTFSEFGKVVDIRIFKDKCFGFVKMETKDAACQAIVNLHGSEIGGYTVRCSWGKEMPEGAMPTADHLPPQIGPQIGPQKPNMGQTMSAPVGPQQAGMGGVDPQTYYQQMQMAAGYYGGYPSGGYPAMPNPYMQNMMYGYSSYGQGGVNQMAQQQGQWQQGNNGYGSNS